MSRRRATRGAGRVAWVCLLLAVAAVLVFVCIHAVRESRRQMDLASYPRKYAAQVERACKEYNLERALVYGLIRQESKFNPNARSSAGARGLMQITPDTFQWLQSKMDQTDKRAYTEEDLYDPDVNIRFGCKFLSMLLKEFSDRRTALAAYNAGRGRVGQWLQDPAYSHDGKTLSLIPFAETSAYTQKVLANCEKYRQLYDAPSSRNSAK